MIGRTAVLAALAAATLVAGGSSAAARPTQPTAEASALERLTARHPAARARIERGAELERRPTFAAGEAIVSRVVDGVLTVISDAGDPITVSCTTGLTKVNGSDPGTGPAACNSIEFMEIFGGPGENAINLSGANMTAFPSLFGTYVDGGAAADSITVGSVLEWNYIHGGRGNDTITGVAGSQCFTEAPSSGCDVVAFEGTDNADVITATETQITAGFETDTIAGVESFDLFGRGGNDTLVAQFGDFNFLFGEEGNDDVTGAAGTDFLFGHDGEDPDAAGADTLRGNAGNDYVEGAGGADTLDAGEGNDYLDGGLDTDTFSAGAGNDEVWSRDYSAETVSCGEGADVAEADPADALNADCETRNVAPTPPFNTSSPTVSGTPQQGQTLTASPGTWLGNPTSFAYFWLRCGLDGFECDDILGATAQSYTLTAADVGFRIRVWVDATNTGGTESAVSEPTAPVAPAPPPPPPPPPAPPPPPPPPPPPSASPAPRFGSLTCTKWGTRGSDVIRGTARRDVLCGLGGNDVLVGRGGRDVLAGGGGNDRLTGGGGTDNLVGGGGRDTLSARDGRRDTVNGGAGRDRARVDAGVDRLRSIERRL